MADAPPAPVVPADVVLGPVAVTPVEAAPAPAPPAPEAEPVPERRTPAPRPRLIVRLFDALLTVMQTGIVGVLIGVVIGGIRAYRIGAEVPLEAAGGGALGGMAGLALGVLIAFVLFLFPTRQKPEA
jgi:hypothetical protein